MKIDLKQSDEIWTQDGHRLGHPHRIYHRMDEINPALELYPAYVHVLSFDLGDDFYIPTDFLNGRNADSGHVLLSVPMETVLKNSWDRLPDFVIQKVARPEELPGKLFSNGGG